MIAGWAESADGRTEILSIPEERSQAHITAALRKENSPSR